MCIRDRVGFTGGYNLADEYFNLTSPYGHWKDTGVRLEGDAVKNLTVLFLEMWNSVKVTDTDFARYLPDPGYTAKGRGFVPVSYTHLCKKKQEVISKKKSCNFPKSHI